jgi:antagonist of KipI
MTIFVEKPGILTTVQDLGRSGFRRFGINPGGVMDPTAARLINILVKNDENEAVLEMHFPAPKLVFEASVLFVVGGADFAPRLNSDPIENWRQYPAKKGDRLKFTGRVTGSRAYLAIQGGLKIERWLNSSTTNLTAGIGGFDGRKLEAGDRIKLNKRFANGVDTFPVRISHTLIPHYSRFPTVRIIRGAEFDELAQDGRELLLKQDFVISNQSNRMGFRLTGEPISLAKPRELISSAVSFGTIQMLPDGQLIVLMADHQTAGGYPRIAHVISRDLPLIGQLGAGDKVAFHLVDLREAEQLALEFENELNYFRVGCKFQAHLL